MNIEVFFGYIALITSLIVLLPQVYKAYITKSTHDISIYIYAYAGELPSLFSSLDSSRHLPRLYICCSQ